MAEMVNNLSTRTILVVFGTRPEAIKMCPLVLELRTRPGVRCVVCVTGQHKEMLDQVLQAFAVVPDYDLAIMKEGQTLGDITSAVLTGMDAVLAEVAPDVVLVHGDTTTSFAAALASFYRQIPVGHVEAGLRTWDLYSPYPEEFNRQVVDKVSTYCFAPTELSRRNLLKEGIAPQKVIVTGNTVIDALKTTVNKAFTHPMLEWAEGSRLILVTSHRRESFGAPMRRMFSAIRSIVELYPDVKVVYPVHPNPVVRKPAKEILGGLDRVRLIEPLEPIEFHNLLAHCYFALTDSGGVQEEAPSLGKPVLVMREVTERPEGVQAGTLKVVGTQTESIVSAASELLDDSAEYQRMAQAKNPYGDGFASRRIADTICIQSI